ncbi:unnamed protein product [Pieris macdunnoughi]|uniref:SWIM-type domain-containing protein n=1 Tax=Pieris macdunnoughi TaxID=345717 RepID=A0A821LB12_9NEOP|nr:unnamed protein product [Pieris macdunnoughi]
MYWTWTVPQLKAELKTRGGSLKGRKANLVTRLQYEVNIKIHARGSIEESQCECVAGSGTNAHCKHVATVLYAIEHMVREKIIIKHQVPTEKLQKFHVPQKVFTASPMITSKLPMKRNVENTIFSPCSMLVDKEEYKKRFRSLILNYPSKMPIKHLYELANPYAVEWDHTYCKENAESNLLNMFNLICITPEKVAQIEHETCTQFLNKNWYDYRMVRLTASKFHTICSLRAKSQENYAKQLLIQRSFSSRPTNHGIINEPVALQQYMEQTGLQVK